MDFILKFIAVAIVGCWFVHSVAGVQAGEWNRFRGPNGAGVADGTGIPTQFSETDFVFKTKLPGDSGGSSPVVSGDKIFVMSADSSNATRYIVCLHAVTGKVLWSREFASTVHHLHSRSTYASCTPAVDEKHVYVAWATPKQTLLKAFSHDGDEVWSRDLGPWQSQHGFGTSPIVYNGMVILHNSQQADKLDPGEMPGVSRMTAFDTATGKTKWSTKLTSKNVCYSVPFVRTSADGKAELVCSSTGDGMFALDCDLGQRRWAVNDGLFRMRTVASPIEAEGLIFGSNGSGSYSSNFVVAVKPGAHAAKAYQLKNGRNFKAPYVSCLVSHGSLVFAMYDKGFATCFDAATGKTVWIERVRAAFSGSPIRLDDRIFCIAEDGTVWVFAATDQYQVLAKNSLGESSKATPAVANGRMYLRTDGHLICVGAGR